MKPPIRYTLAALALTVTASFGQEAATTPPPGVLKLAITLPPAITDAPVRREKIVSAGEGGGNLTIQVIDAPVLPPPAPPPASTGTRLTPEQRAAMLAAAPEATRLFYPYITVYPNGVSHISWAAPAPVTGEATFEAWVNMDLSAFEFLQDINVGKTRYVMMPLMQDHRWRSLAQRIPPAPADFKKPAAVILIKGDPQNQAAMAPLQAALNLYSEKGPELIASAAARKAAMEAIAEWERRHPSPKPSAVIKLCPLDAQTLSTLNSTAPAK
jgi:hypothetical protein